MINKILKILYRNFSFKLENRPSSEFKIIGKSKLIFSLLLFSNIISAQINFTNSQAASLVIGQANFTTNSIGCTQSGLNGPSYTAISSKGVLAVSEQTGGRVKLWNPTPTANGANASVVVGKISFTDCTNTGPSQASISNSNGVAFSPDGNKLIVTDFGNHRVLIWNTIPTVNGQNADVVLGQPNFTTNSPGVSATAMNGPEGAFVSSDGRLIIAEYYNNRILIWNSIPTTNNQPADVVVGQTVFNAPGGGTSATTMINPWGVSVSPDGKLLVADTANNRVLVWNTIPTTNGAAADVVIGQTSMTNTGNGITDSNLNQPIGVTVSPSGKLAIGEFGSHRVLIYNSIPTTNGAAANVVLGQPNFTSSTALYPSGSPTNNNMVYIYNASFDLYGRLYVVGREMNRVMVFGAAPTIQANLGIAITSNIATACLGTSNTITITITNATATAATGVIATASLPAGFTYSSHSASAGTYNPTSGYWNVGTVPASGSTTITINGIANVLGNLSAFASIIQSNQLDPVLSDNGASVSYSIINGVVLPPPTGSANQTFCNAATISNLVATGTAIQWYANPTLGSSLSSSSPLVNGFTYYASQTEGVCESSTRLPVVVTIQPSITYYEDVDGDGFGNPASQTSSCIPVVGFVLNNSDCNDNQLQYADLDGDGFGSTVLVACGITNNLDFNDTVLTYVDADADGFGSTTLAANGVTNSLDCNDNQLQYADLDGDGFGSIVLAACGVIDNTDCNDNEVRYLDADADGYGDVTMIKVACGGSLFSTDCNDAVVSINPGAIDVCYDGIDNDCNGVIDNVGQPGGCTPKVSSLIPSLCGATVSRINATISCTYATGAQGFRFRVTKVDMNTNTPLSAPILIDRPVANFSLSNIVAVSYNSKYQVEVSVKFNNVYQPFNSNPCFVTIESPVATIGSQCGSTLNLMNQWVNSNVVPQVGAYKFRVTQLDNLGATVGASQEFVSSLARFNMTQFVGALYNTSYKVEVSLRNTDLNYLPYNPPCTITTPAYPTTQVREAQCNEYIVPNNSTNIYANLVSGGTAYRFRVYLVGSSNNIVYDFSYDASINRVTLNNFPGLAAGITYTVQAAVRMSGQSAFGPYSTGCSIVTPSALRTINSETVLEVANVFEAIAYPNPFTENFQLEVKTNNEADLEIRVYDMIGKLVEQKTVTATDIQTIEVGSNYPSGVYNVIVSQEQTTKTLRVIKR
jgi:uncharacterized repeat protein (TIGR01451 family)